MRAAKVQASLRIHAVSPEPPLLAHTSSEVRGTFRQKARSLASLNGWTCAVTICHDGMLEDTNSLDGARLVLLVLNSFLLINTYSLIPNIESYPKANQDVFDNFSCQWDRHLPLNVPQVTIHVHFPFDWREKNYDHISNYRSTVLFLTVVFPWSKFRQAKICVRN